MEFIIKKNVNSVDKEFKILIDDEDYDKIKPYKWTVDSHGYVTARVTIGYRKRQWFIIQRIIAECPLYLVVDHINGNRLDNRKSNLRICTLGQNAQNRTKKTLGCSSKQIGVYFDKEGNRWRATIHCNKTAYNLGSFDAELEAIEARKLGENRYASTRIINTIGPISTLQQGVI